MIFNESFNTRCFEVLQNLKPAGFRGSEDLKDLRYCLSMTQLPHCEREELQPFLLRYFSDES